MPAYMVFTRTRTKNQSEMDIYSRKVGATFPGHDVQVLAAYGPHEVFEGEPHEGIVILSFPSTDAAKDWYDSGAYRDTRKHRFAGADYQVTLVQGV